jgi:Ca2+-binding EF-hand superfamily protein
MNRQEVDALLKSRERLETTAKKGFEEVDTNGSGKIDFEEVEKGLKSFARGNGLLPPSRKDVEDVYTQLDMDKSGKIDYNEFVTFFELSLKTVTVLVFLYSVSVL